MHRLALQVALVMFSLAMAAYLAPWMDAGTHPLVVEAQVFDGATLEAVLDDGWTAQLVKATDGKFVAELPPRREYSLALRASGGDCRISDVSILRLQERPIGTLFEEADKDSPVLLHAGQAHAFTSALPVTHGAFWRALAAVFCLLALLAYGCVALWRKDAPPEPSTPPAHGFSPWQWGAVLCLAGAHVWLVATATPLFWTSDSIGYTTKALALYEHGKFYTDGIYYEILRTPGAPLFEALAWKLFGFSLASVVLLQGLVYCAAAAFALDAVARASSRTAALLVAPLVFLSPPAISCNRLMASEGPFLIFALLTTACFLRAMQSANRRSWAWIGGATLGAICAVMVRPNGVVLLALPLFLLGRLCVQAMRTRKRPAWRSAALWLVPVAGAMLALGGWSLRNYIVQKYFSPTDIVGLSAAEATFKGGTLDLRASANDDAFYAQIVKGRRDSNYNFEAWALASLYQKRVAAAGPVDKTAAKRVDGMLADFAARTNAAIPWQARTACLARIFRWGLFLDKDANYQPYGPPNFGFVVFPASDWDYTNSVIGCWVHPRLVEPQQALGSAQRAFNVAVGFYKWGLIAGVLMGLAMFALAAANGWWLALALLFPYFGNLLLNALLGVVIARYVYVLEPFLWLGIAVGFAECLRAARQCALNRRFNHS